MPRPPVFDDFPEELWAEYGPYMCVVLKVHDGDTLLLEADAGLDHHPVFWVRLLDVKAPELWQPGGPECAEAAAALLPVGTPLRVTTEKTPESRQEKKTFVRYVASLEKLDSHGKALDVNDLIRQITNRVAGELAREHHWFHGRSSEPGHRRKD